MERRLTDIMEFDHVIFIDEFGEIDDKVSGVYAPDLLDGELSNDDWELLNGFSGQDRYSGPLMHQSEFIGGGLEKYIRETPGTYVSLVNYEFDEEPATTWAVAKLKEDKDCRLGHNWGEVELTTLTQTLHRRCQNCKFITLDLSDDDE